MAKPLKKNSDIYLVLAGGLGPDFPDYNEAVQSLVNQHDRVQYIGHYAAMISFLNGCDVVVNNSTAEGSEPLGTTIYEAMSCETIAMASNTGGSPEIIDHNVNGFLFEPDNQEALVKVIAYVAANFSQLETIKKAGREKVKNKFGYKEMVKRYFSLVQ